MRQCPILWWKRRVQGRLIMPPLPKDRSRGKAAAAAAAILGILYPLAGATMVILMVINRFVGRRSPA